MKPTLAIDVDGTLTQWPHVLGPLARDLRAAGWEVIVLTGALVSPVTAEALAAAERGRRLQLAGLLPDDMEIVHALGDSMQAIAAAKADVCLKRGVALLIDDDSLFAEAVRRGSPTTCVLGVWP